MSRLLAPKVINFYKGDIVDDKVLKQFMSTFMFLQRFDCLDAIDAMFLKIINADWSQETFATNKLLIATFCRANFSVRNKLTQYEPFLAKSIKYLEENNYNPSDLLKGII
jgi:hypothetical protein